MLRHWLCVEDVQPFQTQSWGQKRLIAVYRTALDHGHIQRLQGQSLARSFATTVAGLWVRTKSFPAHTKVRAWNWRTSSDKNMNDMNVAMHNFGSFHCADCAGQDQYHSDDSSGTPLVRETRAPDRVQEHPLAEGFLYGFLCFSTLVMGLKLGSWGLFFFNLLVL